MGNDDEYEQTMGPFIEKIVHLREMDMGKFPRDGEWGWLGAWRTPIVEARLEELSERGRNDAKVGLKQRGFELR